MLQNMARHPNAGAVLVIGLGCENNQVDAFRATLGMADERRLRFMVCQQQDDEVEAGLALLHELYREMRHDRREPGRLSELKFGPSAAVRTDCRVSPPTRCWGAFPIM